MNCPACGGPVTNASAPCPSCGVRPSQELIGVSETIPPVPNPPPRPANSVPCPMCSEPIARDATRCKWCGESIGKATGMGAPVYAPPPPPVEPAPTRPPDGSTVLIVGILSIVLCALLGPVAWVMGHNYKKQCAALGVQPDGSGTAGMILGIIATFLILAGCGCWASILIAGAAGA